jgi:hypothetical protein
MSPTDPVTRHSKQISTTSCGWAHLDIDATTAMRTVVSVPCGRFVALESEMRDIDAGEVR